MKTIETTRLISAPIEKVFETISGPEGFCQAVPHITKIEFLTDQQGGAGTRFRETRIMNGREATVELKIEELVKNQKVRMVSDAGGTVWDTVFTVCQKGDQVEMHMAMQAKPHKLMARLINPLIRSMVVKGVEGDMDSIKSFCESSEDFA